MCIRPGHGAGAGGPCGRSCPFIAATGGAGRVGCTRKRCRRPLCGTLPPQSKPQSCRVRIIGGSKYLCRGAGRTGRCASRRDLRGGQASSSFVKPFNLKKLRDSSAEIRRNPTIEFLTHETDAAWERRKGSAVAKALARQGKAEACQRWRWLSNLPTCFDVLAGEPPALRWVESVQGLGNQGPSGLVRLYQAFFYKKNIKADADGFRPFPMISNQFQSIPITF